MRKFILAVMTAVTVTFASVAAPFGANMVQAATLRSNLEITDEKAAEFTIIPGKDVEVEIPVRATIQAIIKPAFTVTVPEDAPFTVGKVKAVTTMNGKEQENYTSIGYGNNDTVLRFTVSAKETAKIGKYKFVISYDDMAALDLEDYNENFSKEITLTAVVKDEIAPSELAISDLTITGEAKPGNTVDVSFSVVNSGELTAKNVCVSAEYSGQDILPAYTDYTKKLGDIESKQSKKVTLKVKILSSVTESVLRLPIHIEYKNSDGVSFTGDSNSCVFLEIDVPKKAEEGKFNNGSLLIDNVKQSPEKPKAGDKVTMTFDLRNTGDKAYTGMKLFVEYISESGFEPINANPYQYIGSIGAGQKQTVTVTVYAGKQISAGMQNLGVTFEYTDGTGSPASEKVNLHVLNVQSAADSMGNSKPKLMVSEFATDREEIKTGESFDFTFKVFNTHSEVSAKNIKVTVNSETYSVTKGSNSFFIKEIKPGESEDITINLKANAAATTGSYPIQILMEYEYDGMRSDSANGDGVSVTETKMLLVKENLRVSVENLMLGSSWMTPTEGQTTQLSFTAYNMGKSMLNNVYFTVEGDVAIANGSSYYYGTLQAGSPDYVEIDVIPLASGNVSAMLTIHMEDSNGDEITVSKEISGMVNESGYNGGGDDPYDYPDNPVGPVNPVDDVTPVIPVVAYPFVLLAAFLLGLFVTRAWMISSYKKKHSED